jgi:hypothetical protein
MGVYEKMTHPRLGVQMPLRCAILGPNVRVVRVAANQDGLRGQPFTALRLEEADGFGAHSLVLLVGAGCIGRCLGCGVVGGH